MKRIGYVVLMLMAVSALGGCGKGTSTDASGTEQTSSATPAASTVAAQASAASRYDGKIVRRAPVDGSKEDGWFYVKDGKRSWIEDSAWLATKGLKPQDVIQVPADVLSSIPEDPEPLGAPKR